MTGIFDKHGRTSARVLGAAFRWLKEHPNGAISTGDWAHPTCRADEFRRWFQRCLNEKITSHMGLTGRKRTPAYQRDLAWDADRIRDYCGRRIRNSGCSGLLRTPEMQHRYPHINRQPRVMDWWEEQALLRELRDAYGFENCSPNEAEWELE